ncbi:MAG: hypothetical protein HYS27_12770 [Deltaproteobacteria bacterium]|nr:hypothetical protein [Deltaproteobacteria bacterium]
MKLLAAVAAAALAAGGAAAQNASGTTTTRVQARADNGNDDPTDDDLLLAEQRAEASVAAGDVRAAARVDGELVLGAADGDERSGLALERLTLEWDVGELALTAGDFAAQLGRGLALSVRPAPEIGVDHVVRGGRVGWQGERLDVSALLGVVNAAGLDPLVLRRIEDSGDLVAGVAAGALPIDGVGVTVLGSLVVPGERVLDEVVDWTGTGGVALDVQDCTGAARAGLEVDVQQRTLAGVPTTGAAAVGDVGLRIADADVAIEGLYLASFEVKGSRNTATGLRFSYSQPPTLELLAQEGVSDRDVVGARTRVELPVLDGLRARADGVVRVAEPRAPLAMATAHGALGLELARGPHRWASRLGVRTERLGLDKLAELRDLAHLDGDALVDLGRGFALHAVTSLELWRTPARPYLRGTSSLALELRDRLSIAIESGVDSQDPSPGVRHTFLAASALVHLTPKATLRAIAGSQRGGIACLGGVCRRVPPFAGAKAELQLRF